MLQSYGNYGWCNFWAAIFNYFMVMNDFGFAPKNILNKNSINIYRHGPTDHYNPGDTQYFGNTNLAINPSQCYKT
jgi:hypothetical protein